MIHFPTVKKLLAPYKVKYLAVSGGIDSMVMLDIMAKIYSSDELVVCYFEHNVDSPRGEREFIQDSIASKKRWHDIKFVTDDFVANKYKYSFEATARNQRYDWLTSLSSKNDCVVTAHHLDDQIETLLFRLFTNRDISGISTVLKWRSGIDIIRPFLTYSKDNFIDWKSSHGLEVMEDPTNQDVEYADRNFIREVILKKVKERFGKQDHLIRLLEMKNVKNS